MKTSEIIIAHPASADKYEALKAILKALKIKFEIPKKKSPYNPEFVKMILEAEQEIKDGKGLKVTSKEFDNLWK